MEGDPRPGSRGVAEGASASEPRALGAPEGESPGDARLGEQLLAPAAAPAIAVFRRSFSVPVEPPARVAGRLIVRAPAGEAERTAFEYRAYLAFALRPRPGRGEQAGDLELQREVLGYLLALPAEGWSVQLRLIARPPARSGAAPTLSVSLLGCAPGPTRAAAARAARSVGRALELAGDYLSPIYEVAPVMERAALLQLLRPFPVSDLIEIGRRREKLRLPAGVITAPVPLPEHGSLGRWLAHALTAEAARGGASLLWAVALEAGDDAGIARSLIEDALAVAFAAEQFPGDDLDGGIGVADRLRRIGASKPARASLETLWQRLGGRVVGLQAFLASERAPVPQAVVAAAVAETSDNGGAGSVGAYAVAMPYHPVRPGERALARQALAELRCVAWEDAYAAVGCGSPRCGATVSSLARLADVRQAAALFRIPVPGRAGLPGLPAPRVAREIWLPAALAVTPGGLLLGDNVDGRRRQEVRLALDDRRRHVYVCGQTGVGKSTFQLNCILQDLRAGHGVCVIDPHGDLIGQVLALMPPGRVDDVVMLDPSDRAMPVGFNFLQCADEDERDQVVESFMGMLQKLFDPHNQGIVGPRFRHAARCAMLTAMATPGMTLVEVVRLFTDSGFVRQLLPNVKDPVVRRYWTEQIAQTTDFHKSEVLDYIIAKFSPFVHNKLVRNILGQSRSTFDLRAVLDEGKVLLINLAQGLLGPELSGFLGAVLVPKILFGALARVAIPEAQRRDFMLYVDEFQQYATPAFVDIVSGARKYRLNITMANQHVGQLPADVRHAILGNVGTIASFRVGIEDAPLLSAALHPSAFTPADFLELPNFRAIVQALHGGRRGPAFSLATRPAPTVDAAALAWAEEVRERSRRRYGRPRERVEREMYARARLLD